MLSFIKEILASIEWGSIKISTNPEGAVWLNIEAPNVKWCGISVWIVGIKPWKGDSWHSYYVMIWSNEEPKSAVIIYNLSYYDFGKNLKFITYTVSDPSEFFERELTYLDNMLKKLTQQLESLENSQK